MLKEIITPKPLSRPEIIEFLRELLITAHNENVTGVMYVLWGEDGREAHGIFDLKTTVRDLERAVDFLDAWVADMDWADLLDEEEDEE